MRGVIFLLLSAVALSSSAVLNHRDCLSEETVNILHPHANCNKYYQCDAGKYIVRVCQANLLFNVRRQRCDWPRNVVCEGSVDSGSDENDNESPVPEPEPEPEPEDNNGGAGNNDPNEAANICATDNSDGILIAHEYCNKFYKCFAGKPVAMSCPTELFFNPYKDQCDYPKNVDCDREVAPGPAPEPEGSDENGSGNDNNNSDGNDNGNGSEGGGHGDPSEAASICAADNSDSILVAHEYCNKFYICFAGQPVAMSCPDDLFFNPSTDQCDHPENVDCDREVAPGPAPEPESSEENGSGNENSNEDNNSSEGGGNGNPDEAPSICAAEDSNGILVAHEYCNQFYICFAGRPVAMRCPGDLFFNPSTDQCDYRENVNCDREVAPGPAPEPESNEENSSGNENSNEDNNSSEGGGNGNPDEAPSICAAEDSDGILVAHEYCNQFYICFAGKPVAMRCPGDLFFNPSTDQCDYRENVNCDREVAPGPAPEPESSEENGSGNENSNEDNNSSEGGGHGNPDEAPSICAAEDSDGILVAHEYCNQFYICFAGKPVAMRCPGDLFFNPSTDQCDYRENVNCDREVAPGPAPEPESSEDNGNGNSNEDNNSSEGGGHGNPDEAPSICAAEDSDGILVAHEYCNQFYICFAGKPVAMRCPGDLFFNPSTDQCDYRENVNCDREVAPGPAPEPESSEENGNGNENSNEDNNSSEGGGHGNPDEAPSICAAEDSDGILVAHEYCNQFYICFAGKPVAMRCPGDLFFNPSTDQCDYRENVNCDREVAPGPAPEPESSEENGSGNENSNEDNSSSEGGGHGNPDEAPAICAAEDSDGILVAHEYCNQFYICFAGKPVAMRCPGDLFFNPSTDQCDYRENVNCDREVAPGPAPEPESSEENSNGNDNSNEDNNSSEGGGHGNPDEAPSICAAEDSDGILVAHEYCNQFYICFAGKPVAMRCPGDLFFNPSTDQCDYRENVNCDREVAPGPAPEPESSEENGSGNENSNEDNNSSEGGGHGNPDEAPSICAAEDSDGILVAHEYCNQFYICFAGKPVAMRCPGDLFFNPSTDQCDYRENVNCDREVTPGPAPEPESSEENGNGNENSNEDNNSSEGGGHGNPDEAPSICAAEDSDGILVAHEYCNQFYICFAGKPVAMRCPGDLFFNPSTDQCDYRENVNCDREVAPGPAPEPESSEENSNGNENSNEDNNSSEGGGHGNPDEAPSICAAEDSDGILVAHEYCNQFYICFAGKPVAMRCPGDLFFNPSTDQCDYRDNVNCDREVAPGPAPEPESSEENGSGNENSNEDNNSSEGGGHGNPDEAPFICAAEDSHGILVAHEYCNQFYICFAGKPVAMRCPGNLFFNPSTDQCDYRENVNCDREVAPGPAPNPESSEENGSGNENSNEDNNSSEGGGHGNPDEAPSICAAEDSDGILVAHEYCNQFYVCFAGKPVAMRCPGELFFNPSTDQCDYRENVNCDREVAPGPAPEPEESNESDNGNENSNEDNSGCEGGGHGDPSEAESICATQNSNGILVAHEYCNKFYKCHAGKPVALSCPHNLFFNPSIDQCDWPENVDCDRGVSTAPTPDNSGENGNDSGNDNDGGNNNENGSGDNNGGGGGNSDPSEAEMLCAAEGSNNVLVAHENCNQFQICHEGKPYTLSCPQNLYFNPHTDQCDWPENVKCDRDVAPVPAPEPDNGDDNEDNNTDNGNSDSSEAENICATEDSDGVLVPHKNCNQFYKCSEGKPEVLTCPVNLLYNPSAELCDWPENVDCQNRFRFLSVNKHIMRRSYYV